MSSADRDVLGATLTVGDVAAMYMFDTWSFSASIEIGRCLPDRQCNNDGVAVAAEINVDGIMTDGGDRPATDAVGTLRP